MYGASRYDGIRIQSHGRTDPDEPSGRAGIDGVWRQKRLDDVRNFAEVFAAAKGERRRTCLLLLIIHRE